MGPVPRLPTFCYTGAPFCGPAVQLENHVHVQIVVSTEIETPCVKICTLDLQSDTCTGCGRTRAEIAAWAAMSPVERRRIMERLAGKAVGMHGSTAATGKGP